MMRLILSGALILPQRVCDLTQALACLIVKLTHVQIAYLKSEFLILNLLPNFKIFRSQTSLNKLLATWHLELAKMYGLFCSRPPVSWVSAVRSPYTVSCSDLKRLHSLHLCCWLYCELGLDTANPNKFQNFLKISWIVSELWYFHYIVHTYTWFTLSTTMLIARVRLQTL